MQPEGLTPMNRTLGRIALGLLLAGLALPGRADFGDGIRIGGSDGVLHPFVEAELLYDTNVLYSYTNNVVPDLVLHVRPGLSINVPGDAVSVDFRGVLDRAQYFGLSQTTTTDLSAWYADVSLDVGINRKGALGLELKDQFTRNDQPAVYSLLTGAIADTNDLALQIPWRPGAGALSLTLGGDWLTEAFEPFFPGQFCGSTSTSVVCNSSTLSQLGFNKLTGGLELAWRFLPRTSVVVKGSYFGYVPNSLDYNVASTGLKGLAGLSGLVTTHLAATLEGGYGETLSVSTHAPLAGTGISRLSNLQTWLAIASVEWLPSEGSGVKLGYTHDLGDDPGLQFALYDMHQVMLDAHAMAGTRTKVGVQAGYTYVDYHLVTASAEVTSAKPYIDYQAARWLTMEVAYQYARRTTALPSGSPIQGFIWNYSDNQVWLKAILTY